MNKRTEHNEQYKDPQILFRLQEIAMVEPEEGAPLQRAGRTLRGMQGEKEHHPAHPAPYRPKVEGRQGHRCEPDIVMLWLSFGEARLKRCGSPIRICAPQYSYPTIFFSRSGHSNPKYNPTN